MEVSPFWHQFSSCLLYSGLPLGRAQCLHCLPASCLERASYLFLSLSFSSSADRHCARESLWTFVLKRGLGSSIHTIVWLSLQSPLKAVSTVYVHLIPAPASSSSPKERMKFLNHLRVGRLDTGAQPRRRSKWVLWPLSSFVCSLVFEILEVGWVQSNVC